MRTGPHRKVVDGSLGPSHDPEAGSTKKFFGVWNGVFNNKVTIILKDDVISLLELHITLLGLNTYYLAWSLNLSFSLTHSIGKLTQFFTL